MTDGRGEFLAAARARGNRDSVHMACGDDGACAPRPKSGGDVPMGKLPTCTWTSMVACKATTYASKPVKLNRKFKEEAIELIDELKDKQVGKQEK